jgi:hypothetical protein
VSGWAAGVCGAVMTLSMRPARQATPGFRTLSFGRRRHASSFRRMREVSIADVPTCPPPGRQEMQASSVLAPIDAKHETTW